MNKLFTRRSRISIILALLVLSFAFIFCGISSYSFNANADAASITATLSPGTIWGCNAQNTAPNGLTGQSYSPASENGWTMKFSSSVNISSFNKSKLVMKIWIYRANANQCLCQMNLNGDSYRINSATSTDSSSNPINNQIGSLTGWMQLQFPITDITLTPPPYGFLDFRREGRHG